MQTPRCRRISATGAFLFPALLSLLAVALLPACATRPSSRAAASAPKSVFAAPIHAEVGRVLRYDAADRTVVVEFVPQFRPNFDLTGRALIVRDLVSLAEQARLTAAPYQRGRYLGAYVTEGTPNIGDEVVLAP
jgi:hypothetical protein